MEDRNRIIILYDYYEKLLTERQREYFEEYYFNNLSLSEIAENKGVSRNAIHNELKIAKEKIEEYENKLKLYKKNKEVEEVLKTSELKEEIMNILEGD